MQKISNIYTLKNINNSNLKTLNPLEEKKIPKKQNNLKKSAKNLARKKWADSFKRYKFLRYELQIEYRQKWEKMLNVQKIFEGIGTRKLVETN